MNNQTQPQPTEHQTIKNFSIYLNGQLIERAWLNSLIQATSYIQTYIQTLLKIFPEYTVTSLKIQEE